MDDPSHWLHCPKESDLNGAVIGVIQKPEFAETIRPYQDGPEPDSLGSIRINFHFEAFDSERYGLVYVVLKILDRYATSGGKNEDPDCEICGESHGTRTHDHAVWGNVKVGSDDAPILNPIPMTMSANVPNPFGERKVAIRIKVAILDRHNAETISFNGVKRFSF